MAFKKHCSTLVVRVLNSTCRAGGKSYTTSGKLLSLMACPEQLGTSKYPADHSPASDLGWLGVSTGKALPSLSKQGAKLSSAFPLCPIEGMVYESAIVPSPSQDEGLCMLSSLNYCSLSVGTSV